MVKCLERKVISKMKKIILLVLIAVCISACSSDKLDYKEIMKENEYVIIDVRTKEEYDESHIKDAINIPYDEINENIEIEKDKIIFVYCKSGNRSNIAYNTLNNLGYVVYDLGAFANIDLERE